MDNYEDRKNKWTRQFRFISKRVNKWDPIQLIEIGAPMDEYSCITNKILSLFYSKNSIDSAEVLLYEFIVDHFGLILNDKELIDKMKKGVHLTLEQSYKYLSSE